MYATNYFETAFLNIMRGNRLVAPTTLYAALYISNPGESGTGIEVTYTGYARQPITFTTPAMDSTIKAITVRNSKVITFPKSDVNAGTATHIGILDSAAGGNMWVYGEAREGLRIDAQDAPVLLAGEVVYYSTGNLSDYYKRAFLNVLNGESIDGFTSYLSLFNGNPDSGGAELAGDNYARPELPFAAPAESDSGQMMIQNPTQVLFNRPTTAWGNWSYTAIYDAQKSGRAVWFVEKSPAKEIKKGYMPWVDSGNAKVGIN